MPPEKSSASLQSELTQLLSGKFPGIDVEVSHAAKWNRPCVTFRCPLFERLLPEERYHRLVGVIPAEFRDDRLAGFVWVELVAGESLEDYLKLPRSEDVAGREKQIFKELAKVKLFASLAESMGASPDKTCSGDFRAMDRLLSARRFSKSKLRDAKLLMIRHHAFCDCQVLLTAQPELTRLFADAP